MIYNFSILELYSDISTTRHFNDFCNHTIIHFFLFI